MAIWKRIKQSPAIGGGASLTVTFDEADALNSSHTLVAVLQFTGTIADLASSSWAGSPLTGSGSNGSANYLGIFTMRGDGTTNSFTINFSSSMTQVGVTLMAFEGYVTPALNASVGTNGAGAISATAGPTTGATTANNTIAIAAIGLTGSSGGFGTPSGGFEKAPLDHSRSAVAVYAFTTSGQTPSTTLEWTTNRSYRAAMWVIEGTSSASANDTVAPVIAINSPADASIISGSVVVTATVTDNVGVASVRFYTGDTFVGNGTNTTGNTWVSEAFDTNLVADGVYLLRAIATDTSDNSTETQETVYVQNGPRNEKEPGLYVGAKRATTIALGANVVTRAYLGPVLVFGGLPIPPVQTGTPSRIASYGPNGSHYPARTPWAGDTNWDYDAEVVCDWTAIAAAITTATSNYPNGKVRIRVQPGTLSGNGSGSTSTPVLQNLGALGRASRILVIPRDGAFSITHSASARIHNLKGVSFVGFSPWGLGVAAASAYGFVLTDCQDLAFAWSKTKLMNITTQTLTDNVQIVEAVRPDAVVQDSDSSAVRNGGTTSLTKNLSFIGCYISPSYKLLGSSAHCDSLQFSGGSGAFHDINFTDTAIFASTNAGLIMTGDNNPGQYTVGGTYDHMMIVGGSLGLVRYAQPPEAYQSPGAGGYSVAFNSKPTELVATNQTVIFGSIKPTFKSVTNSRVSAVSVPTPQSGSWTYDASLASADNAWFNTNVPQPTDSTMQAMWSW